MDDRVVQEIVLKSIDNSWRDHKHHTYRKLQEAPTDEMKEAVKPSTWSPRYWAAMIEHYYSCEYQVSFIDLTFKFKLGNQYVLCI